MSNEYTDISGVRLVQDHGALRLTFWHDRPYVSAMGTEDGAIFDLLDLIAWVRANRPELLEVAHE